MSETSPEQQIVQAWQEFCNKNDWKELVKGLTPKPCGCGLVYELPNYLDRPNESFAIADMRKLKVAEPHYHPRDNVEIYIVLQGSGCVVVGSKEHLVSRGDTVLIPPDHAHFTIPRFDFVIAAINSPPFHPDNYCVLNPAFDNCSVRFSASQFAFYCDSISK